MKAPRVDLEQFYKSEIGEDGVLLVRPTSTTAGARPPSPATQNKPLRQAVTQILNRQLDYLAKLPICRQMTWG